MIKILLCVCAVLILLIIAAYFIIKYIMKENKELKTSVNDLKAANERLERNIELFTESVAEKLKIKDQEMETAEKIMEAKTDEELFSIAADIIKRNNDRVRNKTKSNE